MVLSDRAARLGVFFHPVRAADCEGVLRIGKA